MNPHYYSGQGLLRYYLVAGAMDGCVPFSGAGQAVVLDLYWQLESSSSEHATSVLRL